MSKYCTNGNHYMADEDDQVVVQINGETVAELCIHCAVATRTPGITIDNYFALYDPEERIDEDGRRAHWAELQQ